MLAQRYSGTAVKLPRLFKNDSGERLPKIVSTVLKWCYNAHGTDLPVSLAAGPEMGRPLEERQSRPGSCRQGQEGADAGPGSAALCDPVRDASQH